MVYLYYIYKAAHLNRSLPEHHQRASPGHSCAIFALVSRMVAAALQKSCFAKSLIENDVRKSRKKISKIVLKIFANINFLPLLCTRFRE